MSCRLLRVLAISLALCTLSAGAVLDEDFESYANTGELLAPTAWGASYNGVAGQGAILIDVGNPGKAAYHPGGPTANHVISTPVITDANPMTMEFDYWDYAAGASDRMSLSVRNTAGVDAGFFELGEYGAMDPDPFTPGSTQIQGYGFRTVFVGGPDESGGWVAITGNKITGAWHHLKLQVGATYASGSVDLNDDGTVEASLTVPLSAGSGKRYDIVRMGGPSGVSSTSGAGFDNIVITPEPACLAPLLGLAALLRRRR